LSRRCRPPARALPTAHSASSREQPVLARRNRGPRQRHFSAEAPSFTRRGCESAGAEAVQEGRSRARRGRKRGQTERGPTVPRNPRPVYARRSVRASAHCRGCRKQSSETCRAP
jgi:hypothetical protein